MVAFRCPHCGADIQFDPEKGSMKCEYCNSIITIDEYNATLPEKGYYTTNELSCTQCGAVIYSTDNTVATFCSYCGSSVVLRNRIVKEKKPDYIIPFSVSDKTAKEIYRNRIDSLLLAPKWMDDETNVSKFRGIYMPFHLLRYSYEGNYSGEGTSFAIETEHGKKYDVTKTWQIEEVPVSAAYDSIPVDASSSFPDNMSRAITPYTKKKMVPFKEPYLAGYYADSADVPPEIYADKYAAAVKSKMATEKPKVKKVEIDTADLINKCELKGEYNSALFPVWFLSLRNKNRISYAAVNGETGELVADVPLDFKKYLMVSLVVAAAFSLILNIFFTLTPGKFLFATTFLAFVAFIIANKLLNDTYRRKMHYDDAGYIGQDVDKIKEKYQKKNKSSHLVLKIILLLFLYGVIIECAEDFAFMEIIEALYVPIVFIIIIVNVVRNIVGSGSKSTVKEKKAPLYRKILILAMPIAAIIVGAVVVSSETIHDMAYYTAGIFSIIMIILTAFAIVRIQNDFTMRDLPLFTAKRGGE
ncbi:MAG: zinc ribbon domain-containing protein [Lachnospiraceae bacterium]|nr:zinc ribbon domain-containing protein [Lachnospiraceae bacterium]